MPAGARIYLGLVFFVALGSVVPAAAGKIGPDAVWQPDPAVLATVRAQCHQFGGKELGQCFAAAMSKAGASPAAVAFAHLFDGIAYLEKLEKADGPVVLAHVFFPYRANENSAWFLVNGEPELMDVDDHRYIALDQLQQAPSYRALHRRFPDVMLWPGMRGPVGPAPTMRPGGGQRFVIAYVLRNLCHACAIIGRVDYAFDFDESGRFVGTKLLSVEKASG